MASSDRQRPEATAPLSERLPAIDDDAPSPAPADDAPLPAPSAIDGREAFVRAPARRRTQPPASVSSEDLSRDDYAESTSYTARSHAPLSGAGYRRSRQQADKLKRNLRYGQYLEVPKGQRDIFARQGRRPMALAIFIAAAIIVVAVFLAIYFLAI